MKVNWQDHICGSYWWWPNLDDPRRSEAQLRLFVSGKDLLAEPGSASEFKCWDHTSEIVCKRIEAARAQQPRDSQSRFVSERGFQRFSISLSAGDLCVRP